VITAASSALMVLYIWVYMGKDTHALSAAAQRTALEVLAANGVETFIQERDGVTPTPVISRAILVYNQARKEHFADGIVITPSHTGISDIILKTETKAMRLFQQDCDPATEC